MNSKSQFVTFGILLFGITVLGAIFPPSFVFAQSCSYYPPLDIYTCSAFGNVSPYAFGDLPVQCPAGYALSGSWCTCGIFEGVCQPDLGYCSYTCTRSTPVAPPPPPPPPSPPNCNTGLSCSGACSAPPNTCSINNGSLGGCAYTTYSGGGSCIQIAAPGQPCTLYNCLAGFICNNSTCVPPAPPPPPPLTPSPSASPSADKPLVMNGSFYANGGFEFRRNPGGTNSTPAEVVTWRPDFFVSLQTLPTPFRQILDIPTYNWQEVAP